MSAYPHTTYEDEFALVYVTRDVPFSNWSAHQIRIWGKTFPTVEQAFQYQKFVGANEPWARKIQHAPSPWLAKRLAWQKTIDAKAWDARREAVMRELIQAKLIQHEDVRLALKQTQKRAILENSDSEETFWGIGKGYDGLNTLGKIWMSLRDTALQE
jgi:ribA/ribD-fused uncharacterized protein